MKSARELADIYVADLQDDYQRRYARAARHAWLWHVALQALAFGGGVGAAAVAALVDEQAFANWAKWVLVAGPMVAALATAVMLQARLPELWRMREQARIEFQGLANEGLNRLAAAPTEEECSQVHAELIRRAQEIERVQAAGRFAGSFAPVPAATGG